VKLRTGVRWNKLRSETLEEKRTGVSGDTHTSSG